MERGFSRIVRIDADNRTWCRGGELSCPSKEGSNECCPVVKLLPGEGCHKEKDRNIITYAALEMLDSLPATGLSKNVQTLATDNGYGSTEFITDLINRGISAMQQQLTMTAFVQNIKRLVRFMHRKYTNAAVLILKTGVNASNQTALGRFFY